MMTRKYLHLTLLKKEIFKLSLYCLLGRVCRGEWVFARGE